MIKLIVSIVIVLIILSIIGGGITFQSSDDAWQLIAYKDSLTSSIQNGIVTVYEFFNELIRGAGFSD